MRRRRSVVRLHDPAVPLLSPRRLRGAVSPVADDWDADALDARERAAGGRWREARTLAPGEVVIRDERLT